MVAATLRPSSQLRQKHERELQRMQAKLNEKAITLENNRKVLQTQQDLLEKRKAKEQDLEERVAPSSHPRSPIDETEAIHRHGWPLHS